MTQENQDVFIFETVINTGDYNNVKIGLHKTRNPGQSLEDLARDTIKFVMGAAAPYTEQAIIAKRDSANTVPKKLKPASPMGPISRGYSKYTPPKGDA